MDHDFMPRLPSIPRTGILGGTFNPVHAAHVRLACAAADALGLDRVELTPGAVPPHKAAEGILPFDLRCSLLEAAIAGEPRLAVSRLEGQLPPPSYTWNLISAWKTAHEGEVPLFIVGAEDFNQLESWKNGRELAQITSFLVVPRGSADEHAFRDMTERLCPGTRVCPVAPHDALAENISTDDADTPSPLLAAPLSDDTIALYLPLPLLDISASAVRIHWMRNESIRSLTPDSVISLIDAHAGEIRKCWSVFC